MPEKSKTSKLWYLVPIFFGIIGGLIGYLIVKDDDKKMAKKLLIVGLIMSVFWILVNVFMSMIYVMAVGSLSRIM
jgi:hypothetical protein